MPTKTKSGNVIVASLPEGLQVGEYKSLSPDVKRVGQNPISKTFMGMTAWNIQTYSQKKGMTRLQEKKARLGLCNLSSPCTYPFESW